jgi:hypothetical protein
MTARCLSDPESSDDHWEIVSTRGCCTFQVAFTGTRGVVTFISACHGCLNELNVFALERRFAVVIPTPFT